MKTKLNFTNYTDERILEVIFFLFGFTVMSWVPRLPEIKDHLGVNDGQFGTLLSTGAIGALIALLTMGHAVNHWGTSRVIKIGFTANLIGFVAVPHVHNLFIFMILNIAIGFGVSTIHLSANSQVIADQDSLGKRIMPRMHGFWALGALLTALLSSLLIGHVSLGLHLGILMALSWLFTLFLLQLRSKTMLKANNSEQSHFSAKNIFKSFKIDWIVSAGLICAQLIEFTTNDWSAIFARDKIGIKSGLTALVYIIFALTMIAGRLFARRIEAKLTLIKSVKLFGFFGGAGFAIFIWLGAYMVQYNRNIAFILALIGFAIAGFGTSFLGPTFTIAATQRSNLSGSIVIGQLGVINNILVFVLKAIIAWTAQFTSLYVALMIPALMLMAVGLFANATKPVQSK